jgi:hypothetical protein
MKKYIVLLLLIGLALAPGLSQTKIEKTVPVQRGQKLTLDFDYPDLIKVQTWDKNEILIKGEVSINKGENDDAFELLIDNTPGSIRISSRLKDKQNIPLRITIKRGDEEYYFKAKDMHAPEVQKFIAEHGGDYNYMSQGIIQDITLDIFVPRGMESQVNAKYGIVEVKGFDAPLTVDAHYGGVDATISSNTTGELVARTCYGEILTNLDIKFDSNGLEPNRNHWIEIHAKAGSGPKYALESKYGKVYLRKPN